MVACLLGSDGLGLVRGSTGGGETRAWEVGLTSVPFSEVVTGRLSATICSCVSVS